MRTSLRHESGSGRKRLTRLPPRNIVRLHDPEIAAGRDRERSRGDKSVGGEGLKTAIETRLPEDPVGNGCIDEGIGGVGKGVGRGGVEAQDAMVKVVGDPEAPGRVEDHPERP